MKLLLTSNGVTNASIRSALVDLLGKPVEESSALVVPTGISPFSVGPRMAARLLRGEVATPLVELGWASIGLLDLPVLPSISRDVWETYVREADALLFWGGDPVFLAHWVAESGLGQLLPSLDSVWVGVSAGAMAACRLIGETYPEPRTAAGTVLGSQDVPFVMDGVEQSRPFVTAAGAGLVDLSVIPHYENPGHEDACGQNAERWAAQLPGPVYALDDQSALVVRDGVVEVVSEGTWRRYPPA